MRRVLVALSALSLCCLAFGTAPARAVTTGRNGAIVFDAGAADGQTDIYIANADGSGLTPLYASPGEDEGATWSPDGSRIAFDSEDGDGLEIYSMAPNGTDVVQLTDSPGEDAYPAYSPDGGLIAFDSARSGSWQIWVMNADGTDPVQVTALGGFNLSPQWYPFGGFLTFDHCTLTFSDCDIWWADPVTLDRGKFIVGSPAQVQSTWSPDGRYVSFASHDSGWSVLRYDTVKRTFARISRRGATYPAFAPSGTKIAYVRNHDIAVAKIDGTGVSWLGLTFPYVEDPDWQPLCTVTGTLGDNTLQGTGGPDLLCGLGGNDTLSGLGGDDLVFGGDGNDTIRGGDGWDVLAGGAGDDIAFGGAAPDLIGMRDGVSGNDTIDGSAGKDACRADAGDTVMSC
jgi:Tol biopolymer transport system component